MIFHWQYQAKVEPLIPIVTVDMWFNDTERPRWDVKRWQYLYPLFDIDAKLLTELENITLDKWIREPILPRWDLKRQQYSYQNFFGYIEEEPPEEPNLPEWFVNTEIPARSYAEAKRNFYIRLFPFLWWDSNTPQPTIADWLSWYPNKVYANRVNPSIISYSFWYPETSPDPTCSIGTRESLGANALTKDALNANTLTREALSSNAKVKEELVSC